MKHSKFVPLVFLKKESLPIIEIARRIVGFYESLSVVNSNFRSINIISEKKSLYECIDIHDPNAVQYLAEEILNHNKEYIQKINQIANPDINFFRDDFINIGLETKIEQDTLITLSYSFGKKFPRIGSIVVNEICFDTFEKSKFFLDTVEKSFPLEYSVIRISDRELNKFARAFKAPLGIITYFSNDYEIQIPDDLEDIEYVYTEGGKYLILSRDDIATDPEKLDAYKKRIMELMEKIKRRVPDYCQ